MTLTGSKATGTAAMKGAADTITPVSAELGGKSPNIVFPDADLETAVEGTMVGIFFNSGQQCTAGSRLFLHEDIREEFLDRLLSRVEDLQVGDPLSPVTDIGPVLSVFEWSDRAEVIRRANDTKFGLASAIWTEDLQDAHEMAAEIEAGTVWVNTYNDLLDPGPHGGYKQSGVGRELAEEALDDYTQTKQIKINLGDAPSL